LFNPIGKQGQRRLRDSKAVVVGCGALGSRVSQEIVRSGCGYVRLIDRDFVELSNLQRQVLFTEEDVRKNLPKAVAARERLKEINSEIEIEGIVDDLNFATAEKYLSGANVILDGTDNLEVRMLINDYAWKNRIPYIYGAAVSSYGNTMNIIPGKTACLRCLYPTLPPPGEIDTCDTAGVISPVPGVIASVEAAEAIKLLTGNELRKGLLYADLWSGRFESFEVKSSEKCRCCGMEEFEFLTPDKGKKITTLCGRNAVQITRADGEEKINFVELKEKLSRIGRVEGNRFIMKFISEKYEISIFKNGRAIIQGTDDVNKARSLYSRFIGE